MKVCTVDRIGVYALLAGCFRKMAVVPRLMELGVLRGENAARMRQIFSPDLLVLVDAWSSATMADYARINGHRSWVDDLDVYADYFGGRPSQQATFDAIYEQVRQTFAQASDVLIVREQTRRAHAVLRQKFRGERGFDLVYVDANHQYETVLDDLLNYRELLSPTGVFQLNDCCYSAAGVRQNLGVLEAVCRFMKMADFVPLVLTNTDFSDLVLAPRGSPIIDVLNSEMAQSSIGYVELPPQLLASATVKDGSGRMSFI